MFSGRYPWLAILVGLALGGCSCPVEPGGADGSVDAGMDGRVTEDAVQVVARFGDQVVTAKELARQLRLHERLRHARGGRTSGGSLDSKDARRAILMDYIDRKLVRAEAEARGIDVSDEEVILEMERDKGDRSDAWHEVLRDRLLARALARALIGPLDDEALRREYRLMEEKIDVRFVAVSDTPTSEEVTRFIQEHPEEVERYFQEHSGKFRTPLTRTVRYFSMTVPPGATRDEREEIERKVVGFRDMVASGRMDMVDLVRRYSEHSSRGRKGLVGPVQKAQLPAAFSVPVGGVSRVYHDLSGFYFVKVLDEQKPSVRTMTQGLRREVAARALVDSRGNRAAWDLANRVREAMAGNGDLGTILTSHGLHMQQTGLFPRGGGDYLPGFGLVPKELIDRLFTRRPPVPPEPVEHVRNKLLVLQVTRHKDPDYEQMKKKRDQLKTRIAAKKARTVLSSWLASHPDRNSIVIDYDALMAVKP